MVAIGMQYHMEINLLCIDRIFKWVGEGEEESLFVYEIGREINQSLPHVTLVIRTFQVLSSSA